MRYMKIEAPDEFSTNNIAVESDNSGYSFPTTVGNNVYDAFLQSQGLTDEEVQALEPGVWHDMIVPTAIVEEVAAVDAE